MNAVNFVDGLDGLAAGRAGDRRHRVLPLRLPADRATSTRAPTPTRTSRRSCSPCWWARASASCRTTSTRPASSWATRARCCSASCSSRGRDLRDRPDRPREVLERQRFPAFLPMLLPFAVLLLPAARHGARDRPPGRRRQVPVPPGPHAPAPPHARAGPLAPPRGRDHVRLDGGVRVRRRRAVQWSTTTVVLLTFGVAVLVATLLTLGPLRGRSATPPLERTSDDHPRPRPDHPRTEAVFRRRCATCSCCSACSPCVGVGVGYLVDGMAGVWGALIGVGIALIFSGDHRDLGPGARRSSAPDDDARGLMGAWLGKIVVVIVVLVILKQLDFYNPQVLFLVVSSRGSSGRPSWTPVRCSADASDVLRRAAAPDGRPGALRRPLAQVRTKRVP